MAEANGADKDPEQDDDSAESAQSSRASDGCGLSLLGGVLGSLVSGCLGTLTGAVVFRGNWEWRDWMTLICGMLAAVLGAPLGVAIADRLADVKAGRPGRFSPLFVTWYCAWVAGIAGWLLMASMRLHRAFPIAFAALGGLLGYLLSRRRRHDAGPGDR